MATIKTLKEAAAERAIGPKPEFSLPNIVKTILTIGKNRSIGRQILAKEVGVGEGATRTIIERLKKREIITVTAKGCDLTQKGQEIYRDLTQRLAQIEEVEGRELGMGEKYSAILIRGLSSSGQPILNFRDAAVRAGASGAILMISTQDKLTVPSVTDNAEDYAPKLARDLKKKMVLRRGDTVLVCGASNYRDAENAAITVALSMIDPIKAPF